VGSVLADYGFAYNDTGGVASFSSLQQQIVNNLPVPFYVSLKAGGSHSMVIVGTFGNSASSGWVLVEDPGGNYTGWTTYSSWASQNNPNQPWTVKGAYTNLFAPESGGS
jgi:hypothetical protein